MRAEAVGAALHGWGGPCWAPVCPLPVLLGQGLLLSSLICLLNKVALFFGAGAPERVGPAGSARAGGAGGLWDGSRTQTRLCPATQGVVLC